MLFKRALTFDLLITDTQGEGDSATDADAGRRDPGTERDFHFSATGGGGKDQEAEEGKR